MTQKAAKGAAASAATTLVIVESPDTESIGDRLTLEPGSRVVLGRGGVEFAGQPLRDKSISTRHARIELDGQGSISLRDLSSKNGTFVAAARVESCKLEAGAMFQIGGTFLQVEVGPPFPRPESGTLVGGISRAAHELRRSIELTAAHELPVLLHGRTGTGKERAAAEVHRVSGKSGAFVPVNCATLSQQLAESELFGHVRGAFTGAERASKGMFRKAESGTLFLDEIATLPLALQPKLLRAIQEGKVRPVGAHEEHECRPRIVCATNESLPDLVDAGRFREDLFARLLGAAVNLPDLHERREDIGWLAHHLLGRAGHRDLRLDPQLFWALHACDWRLNIRGLEQCLLAHVGPAIEADGVIQLDAAFESALQAQVFQASQASQASKVPPERDPPQPAKRSGRKRTPKPSRAELEGLLETHAGNVGHCATALGVRRQQIYRWIENYDIDIARFR